MLKTLLIDEIKQLGAIDLYTYMQRCQTDPEYGYYSTKSSADILGSAGDFITAPEISSLFGEMIAFWIVTQWEHLGSPAKIQLLELGPGRGVLMRDILMTLHKLKSFTASVKVHLIDINPSFKKAQSEALNGLCELQHHETLDFLHETHDSIIVIANEFFDALPIHQYVQKDDKWYETYVGVSAENQLCLIYQPCDHIPDRNEIQPDTLQYMTMICKYIQDNRGAALIVDYGYWEGEGDSLQALCYHQKVDILDHPGDADLSVHVDFKSISQIAQSSSLTYTYQTQRQFLMDFGIQLRLKQIRNQLDFYQQNKMCSAVQRLIDPAGMGHLFKVLQIWKD